MSDELSPDATVEYKGEQVDKMPTCTLKVVDGHIEAECDCKASGHELVELLEKEVIIRVKPGKVAECREFTKCSHDPHSLISCDRSQA